MLLLRSPEANATAAAAEANQAPCHFPFTYAEVDYTACTSIDHDQQWCITEPDSTGDTVGDWRNCGYDDA